jgi:hypothetical protein
MMRSLRTLFSFSLAMVVAAPALGALTVQHLATDQDLLDLLSDTLYVAEGRIGNNALDGDFEIDLGGSTAAPEVTRQYVWPNGTPVSWSLVYDHTSKLVTFTVGAEVLSWTSSLSGYTDIFVRTRAVDAGTDITVGGMTLDAEVVGDASATSGDASGLDILWIGGGTLQDGFTLTGQATLSWTGATPQHSRLAFQIKVGTLTPLPVEETTWGRVKALYEE